MRRAAAAVVFGVGVALASVYACDDAVRTHVFTGRLYEQARGCLDGLTSIDVVAGPQPETPCAPSCVVSTADAGSLVYVSTMCAPYPRFPYESDAGGDPRCAVAVALYQSNTTCEGDGGVKNAPVDAAAD